MSSIGFEFDPLSPCTVLLFPISMVFVRLAFAYIFPQTLIIEVLFSMACLYIYIHIYINASISQNFDKQNCLCFWRWQLRAAANGCCAKTIQNNN